MPITSTGGGGGIGVGLDINSLLGQIFGGSTSGNTNTTGTVDTTTKDTENTTSNTKTSDNSVTTSSDAAIKSLNDLLTTSEANASDDTKTQGIVSNIIRQAAIAFAPVSQGANTSGVYSSSTLQNLADEAQAAAVGQASQSVLDYKTQQGQIASQTAGNLANATKTTTGSTTSDVVGQIVQAITSNQSTNTKSNTDNTQHSIFSVICTELLRQGKMSKKFYVVGMARAAGYWEWGAPGYYIWAIPVVWHLRNNPNSLFSKVIEKIFNWRAEWVAHEAGVHYARNLLRGRIIAYLLWSFCFLCRITIARNTPDWETELYSGEWRV